MSELPALRDFGATLDTDHVGPVAEIRARVMAGSVAAGSVSAGSVAADSRTARGTAGVRPARLARTQRAGAAAARSNPGAHVAAAHRRTRGGGRCG